MRIGGDLQPPAVVKRVRRVSTAGGERRVEGVVILEATVAEDGSAEGICPREPRSPAAKPQSRRSGRLSRM
jgi:hypothetical protein